MKPHHIQSLQASYFPGLKGQCDNRLHEVEKVRTLKPCLSISINVFLLTLPQIITLQLRRCLWCPPPHPPFGSQPPVKASDCWNQVINIYLSHASSFPRCSFYKDKAANPFLLEWCTTVSAQEDRQTWADSYMNLLPWKRFIQAIFNFLSSNENTSLSMFALVVSSDFKLLLQKHFKQNSMKVIFLLSSVGQFLWDRCWNGNENKH